MKFDEFLKEFNSCYKGITDMGFYTEYVGLVPFPWEHLKSKYFSFGRFNIVPLTYFSEIDADPFGLKIIPDRGWEDWPLVQMSTFDSCLTLADNYSKAPAAIILEYLSDYEIFLDFKSSKDRYRKIASPIFKLFCADSDLDLLYNYISTERDKDINEENEYVKLLKSIMPDQFHLNYRAQLDEMIQSKNCLPSTPSMANFGIWHSSILNKIAMRFRRLKQPNEELLWLAFQNIHGIDAFPLSANLSHRTSSSWQARSFISAISSYIDGEEEEIKHHPLFPAVEAIKHSLTNYTGAEHLIAAAVLDEEHKDPLAAFNALVSGAYWAGHNMKKALPEIHNQMLNLCNREGWTDAEFALSMMI